MKMARPFNMFVSQFSVDGNRIMVTEPFFFVLRSVLAIDGGTSGSRHVPCLVVLWYVSSIERS